MKNLLVKLSLIALLVVACNTASAVFTDNANTYALWHCDATNWAGTTKTTPDDNSSGRTARNLIINAAGEATMMPGSPYGGSYLAMDGTDHATSFGVLDPMPTDYLNIDVSFRANGFPIVGNYKSVLWTGPIRVMLWNNGGTTYLGLLHYNTGAAVATWNFSTQLPALHTWYSVKAECANASLKLTFGNDADGYTTTTVTTGAGLWDGASYVCAGWDPQAANRNLDGDLDEMRVSLPIPLIVNEYFSESTIAELPFQPQPTDLAQGADATNLLVKGVANVWAPDDGLEAMFNSDAVGSYGSSFNLFNDGISPGADNRFHTDFTSPKLIQEVRVFSKWGDARLFTWLEVWVSTTGTNDLDYTYIGTATFGELGDAVTSYSDKQCLARLYDDADGVLASDVTSLMLVSKNCSYGISAGVGNKFAPGTALAAPYIAISGSAVYEIDIIETSEKPTSPTSNLACDNPGSTSIDLSWDDGTGDGRLIICREGELAPSSAPADWTDYTANSTFGDGDSLGDGSVVYKSTGSSVTINDLEANTDYYFQAYEYNGDVPIYNTALATDNPKSITTTPEPGMFFGMILFGLSIIRIKR